MINSSILGLITVTVFAVVITCALTAYTFLITVGAVLEAIIPALVTNG
jgi:hypothetical protein